MFLYQNDHTVTHIHLSCNYERAVCRRFVRWHIQNIIFYSCIGCIVQTLIHYHADSYTNKDTRIWCGYKKLIVKECFAGIRDKFWTRFFTIAYILNTISISMILTFLGLDSVKMKRLIFILIQCCYFFYLVPIQPFKNLTNNLVLIMNELC